MEHLREELFVVEVVLEVDVLARSDAHADETSRTCGIHQRFLLVGGADKRGVAPELLVAQMAVVVAVVWVVYQTDAWWAYLLWFLLVLALSICWCLFPLQSIWKKMLRPVSVAMLVGSIVVGGSAMLMLPTSVFLSIYSVLMACMTASLMQTMMSYQRNQQKPETLREDMFHQVRNLAQPLVMVVPMLYAGMLLGGVATLEGLLVTLLLIAASFVANILAGVIALGMIKKNMA